MTDVDRPQLGWKRPPEWDRFHETVVEEWGTAEPYAGFVLDTAWREYRDDHPIEAYADRLLGAVGRRTAHTGEKIPLTRDASGGGGGRVWTRVHEETKDGMAAFASEAGVPNHEVLRAVVCWHLDGGLLGRVTETLGEAVPEAEAQLADLDPDDDRGLTAEQKKRRWLADDLTGDDGTGWFTRDDFGAALAAMPWRGGDTTHMRETHLQPVLDRIDYRAHPKNADLFIPVEEAHEYAAKQGIGLDAPAIDRKPYGTLTDDERVHGLRVALGRRARDRGGKASLDVDAARDDVFAGTPGARKTKDLMDRAARVDGFQTDSRGGRKRLRCNLDAVTDGAVLTDVDIPDETNPEESPPADATPGGDGDRTETADTDDGETDVAAEMDALAAATPVRSDGGEDGGPGR